MNKSQFDKALLRQAAAGTGSFWESLFRVGGSITRTSTPAQDKAHEVKTAKARKRRDKRAKHNKHQRKMNPQHGRRKGQRR